MPRDTLQSIASDSQGTDPIEEFATRTRVTKDVEVDVDNILGSGWAADKPAPAFKGGDKPERFTVPDDGTEVLIKFLEERPFTSFYQHWIQTDAGKRPFACLGIDPNTKRSICPLCDRSDKAKSVDYLNVLVLYPDGQNELKLWMASPDPAAAIAEKKASKRSSPLNREDLYFAVSKRAGKNGVPTYTVEAVKEGDLAEDWGVKPVSAAEIASYNDKLWTKEVARNQVKSRDELRVLAAKFLKD